MVNSNDLIGTIRFADKVNSGHIRVILDNRTILVYIIIYMSLIFNTRTNYGRMHRIFQT